jgi:diaminohydroxyphosphoribosylaminopyrimidine deaminase/5-amino-6-(5-phosphoribosylamino)uracil reductase
MPDHSSPTPPRFTDADHRWMRRALALARRALGDTRPNPMVGAVLVRGNQRIAEGWHHRAGQPHAEIEALNQAANRRRSTRGTTLYVTLEPCCTHGRTPPCTDAIIAAGIRRVVVAATDPNPHHAAHGFTLLRQAGIRVDVGLLQDQATRLNAGFNHWIQHRTPLVTLKAALTLDGKIATRTGESRWITGERSRAHTMQLRAEHDAILVGVGTVLADDPRLTVRIGGRERAPIRVVLDTHARTPLHSQLVSDAFAEHTRIIVGQSAPTDRVESLQRKVPVWIAPESDGRVDPARLMAELGRNGITSVLVEGGGTVHASLLTRQLAHRIRFFYAPLVVGGTDAPRAIAGPGFNALREIPRLGRIRHRKLGSDLLIEADVVQPPI